MISVIYRLVFGAMLLVFSFSVSAFSKTPTYSWSFGSNGGVAGSVGAACSAGAAYIKSLQVSGCSSPSSPCTYETSVSGGSCTVVRNGNTSYQISVSASASLCPPDSVENASGCTCNTGFFESGGQCKQKKSDKCGNLEDQPLGVPINLSYGSRSVSSMGRMVGKPALGCFPGGCAVTGEVEGCWGSKNGGGGSSGCKILAPKFTGATCDENEDKNNGCPPGTTESSHIAGVCIPDANNCAPGSTPSKYASGVCIPDENSCPSGQSPSKYAKDVCLPEDDPNADGSGEQGSANKCPEGQVMSKYVKDVCLPAEETTDKKGDTTCKIKSPAVGELGAGSEVCVITKKDGTKEEQSKDEFCTKNPSSPLCVKGKFSGACGAGFTCEGDAVQCAMAREQHTQNCKLYTEDKDPASLTNKALSGTDPDSALAMKGAAQQVSVGTFDSAGYGWQRSCPPDPEFTLDFAGSRSFVIPFHRVCGLLSLFSLTGLGVTLLGCLLWVLGSKKG